MVDLANIRIARATRSHLSALVELFSAYREFYGCTTDSRRAHEFLLERIRGEESMILLALEGSGAAERAVGFVQLYPSFSSLRMARMWVLNDFYTRPDCRRQGVGHLLLGAARSLAAGSGASYIELLTARGNRAARRVYESVGYRADQQYCRYTLDLAGTSAAGGDAENV
ncbi:MAG: GNAT family N-acetyltransferase [Gemmatimonadaceae bacterium]